MGPFKWRKSCRFNLVHERLPEEAIKHTLSSGVVDKWNSYINRLFFYLLLKNDMTSISLSFIAILLLHGNSIEYTLHFNALQWEYISWATCRVPFSWSTRTHANIMILQSEGNNKPSTLISSTPQANYCHNSYPKLKEITDQPSILTNHMLNNSFKTNSFRQRNRQIQVQIQSKSQALMLGTLFSLLYLSINMKYTI